MLTQAEITFDWGTIISALLIGVLGPLLAIYTKDFLTRRNIYRRVNRRIEADTWITGKLGAVLGQCEADRAYIFQVHPEREPVYISETYEVTAMGISAEISGHQNLLMSEHNFILSHLLEDKKYYSEDVAAITDAKLRLSLRAHDTKSVFVVGLFSAQGHIKGFLAVDYVHSRKTLTPVIEETLEKTAYEIGFKLRAYKS